MVRIRALGIAKDACGWEENRIDAANVDRLLQLLPPRIVEMKERGELVILINGSEMDSIQDGIELKEEDTVIILPVVHGG